MIKDIFLPERIGDNYLFPKRIVGLEIRRADIYATKILLQGTDIYLEESLHIPLSSDTDIPREERIQIALKELLSTLRPYDELRTSLASSLGVLRELKLPFSGHEAIDMVVQFEVEPLLPFSLNDAVVDFIITQDLPDTQSSIALVAAIQNSHIEEHLALFEGTGSSPDVITLDIFALYGLYKQIPAYAQLNEGVILLSIEAQSTRISYIYEGGLRSIRTIPLGLAHITKTLAKELKIPTNEVMEQLLRFGVTKGDSPSHNEAVNKALEPLLRAIDLTLSSFTSQADTQSAVERIILFGNCVEIKDLSELINKHSGIACETLEEKTLSSSQIMKIKKKVSPASIVSASIALPSPMVDQFNLRRNVPKESQSQLGIKQLATAGILLTSLFLLFFTQIFWQRSNIFSELKSSTQETEQVLKDHFPNITKEPGDTIEDIVDNAETELMRDETTWFKFSRTARPSALAYLLELSTLINKEKIGFIAEQISFSQEGLTLKARVRDHDALVLLERELRQSKMFSMVESPNDPDFTMKMTFKRTSKE